MHSPTIPRCAELFALAVAVLAAAADGFGLHAALSPKPAMAATQGEGEAGEAARGMLGSAAPPSRLEYLSSLLRVVDPTAAAGAKTVSLFSVLLPAAGGDTARGYEASGISLLLDAPRIGKVRIDKARVVLRPSADGRSCAFEVSGSPFGEDSSANAEGSVEWGTGPIGGDRLTVSYRVGRASVEALRTAFPGRFDASVEGRLDLAGKASGVVGETSTEDAPATPLRGDLEAAVDWRVLGRMSPARLTASFSLDDRIVRISSGRLQWQGLALELSGWLDPHLDGRFDLAGAWKDLDTEPVAADWGVPEAWRPRGRLSGKVTLVGKPGSGMLRYDASAPSVALKGLGSWPIDLQTVHINGSLLAVNVDVSASVIAGSVRLGDMKFATVPVGLQWWHQKLSVTTSNTVMWGGKNEGSLAYKPETHPAWSMGGRLANASAADMAAGAVPWLGLDVEGAGAVSYSIGQDQALKQNFSVHTSLVGGRLGKSDLFVDTLAALGAADAALVLADAATLVPRPRKGGAGTRVDKFFTEAERSGEDYHLGGLYLSAGDFRLDADGRCGRDGRLHLDATVRVADAVADRLVAAAPWMAALKSPQGLYLPVTLDGPASAPVVKLAPDYVAALGGAKRGEAVTAPTARAVSHIEEKNLASIPADPTILYQE